MKFSCKTKKNPKKLTFYIIINGNNNNQQTTSLMYYNDSNYFDQHFDGKNKSIYVCLYI